MKKRLTKTSEDWPRVKELRLVMTDACSYSCCYCNLYYKKLLALKRISLSKYKYKYEVGNESHGLLSSLGSACGQFNQADFRFLFTILRSFFRLEDVTFTGGDPFLSRNIKGVIDIADTIGLRTTAITKGAPLFNLKNKRSIDRKLGRLSRIIISLDTLDPREHADDNLPLLPSVDALKFLPQTLVAIKRLIAAGRDVEINSVIKDGAKDSVELLNSFASTKRIIDFCLKSGIKKIKFIELDSRGTLRSPYIEEYFQLMKEEGLLNGYKIIKRHSDNTTRYFAGNTFWIKRSSARGGALEIAPYRTHCPATYLDQKSGKKCEFSRGGELHLDFYGRSFLCQRDKKTRLISLIKSVKNRDVDDFINNILLINQEINKQKCPSR